MRRPAPLPLLSLLTSIVGMLVLFGAVHAYDGHGKDCGRHAEHRMIGSGGEASSVPQARGALTENGPAVNASNLKRMSAAGSDPCEQRGCDHGFDGKCCAVACHSAIGDLGLIVLVSSEHPTVGPLMSAPSLQGRLIGPGDPPPRSA